MLANFFICANIYNNSWVSNQCVTAVSHVHCTRPVDAYHPVSLGTQIADRHFTFLESRIISGTVVLLRRLAAAKHRHHHCRCKRKIYGTSMFHRMYFEK